ncbi:uncharacterized protein LOC106058565 [Biomphalaria glabrata]|uniref:Uncharacterized protein LOC106058565 n=1 Tax=Biomphalaria glabrata TaxID=6526 RepID=A0A9U8E4J2_BIOGL|nr:uncharacterized protein LOC106058565 [Biomphalaria glabrata]
MSDKENIPPIGTRPLTQSTPIGGSPARVDPERQYRNTMYLLQIMTPAFLKTIKDLFQGDDIAKQKQLNAVMSTYMKYLDFRDFDGNYETIDSLYCALRSIINRVTDTRHDQEVDPFEQQFAEIDRMVLSSLGLDEQSQDDEPPPMQCPPGQRDRLGELSNNQVAGPSREKFLNYLSRQNFMQCPPNVHPGHNRIERGEHARPQYNDQVAGPSPETVSNECSNQNLLDYPPLLPSQHRVVRNCLGELSNKQAVRPSRDSISNDPSHQNAMEYPSNVPGMNRIEADKLRGSPNNSQVPGPSREPYSNYPSRPNGMQYPPVVSDQDRSVRNHLGGPNNDQRVGPSTEHFSNERPDVQQNPALGPSQKGVVRDQLGEPSNQVPGPGREQISNVTWFQNVQQYPHIMYRQGRIVSGQFGGPANNDQAAGPSREFFTNDRQHQNVNANSGPAHMETKHTRAPSDSRMPLNAIGNIPEQRNTQMVTSSIDAHGLAYSTFISADDNRVFTVIGNSLDHQGHDPSTLFSPNNADPNADPNADLTLTGRDGHNVWEIGDHNMNGDVNSTTVHGMILNGSVITAMNDGNEIEMSAAAQVSRAPVESWNSTLLGFGHKKAFEYKNLKAPRERIQFNPPVPAPPSQSMMASQISASAAPPRNAVQTSQRAYQQTQNISTAPTVPMTSAPATGIARQPEEFRTSPLHPGFMASSSVIRMMQPQPTTYIPTPIYPQSSVVPPAASYMSQSSVVSPAASYMSQSSPFVPQGTFYMSQSSPFVQPGTSYMSHPAPFVTPAENWMSTPSAMQLSSRATYVPQQWIPHMPPPWAMRMALPAGTHMPSLLAAHRASPQTTQTQDPDTSAPY